MSQSFDLADLKRRMDGAVAAFKSDLAGLRTGRASPSLLDPIMVDAYGSQMPINQVANVNVPEPRMLAVSEKGHIKTFGTYLADLKLFLKRIVIGHMPGPYIAMSHSMGGTPLLQLLAEGDTTFAGAILSSPMTRLFRNGLTRQAVRLMAQGAVTMGLAQHMIFGVPEHSMRFDGNNLTSDRARHTMFRKLLEAAPNAAVHAPTYGWLAAALEALDAINAPGALDGIKVPVRIVASGDDSTVDGANSIRLGRAYDQVTTTVVPGALHEVLMEQDNYRGQFWQAFDACVDALLPVTSGQSAAS